MWLPVFCGGLLLPVVSPSIIENGRPIAETYAKTAIDPVASSTAWATFPPNASELSYKGRWDSKHISWWSAPGLRFGFTGDNVAISFGEHTSPGVLVGFRLNHEDWSFSNVTAGSTHQFVSSTTPGLNRSSTVRTFELRVTNWAYGVQIAGVHLAAANKLVAQPVYGRRIEIIGDSLTAGQYNRYEALSSWAWELGAGLGDTEFSVTAYPGICLVDRSCWGNPRGQEYQWFRTQDTSWRARQLYSEPEKWDFAAHPPADLVLLNIGTNDHNKQFNVSGPQLQESYDAFVAQIHKIWPKAQLVLMSLSNAHFQQGSAWVQNSFFGTEIWNVYLKYKPQGFVHYFNTTGIMRHNDIDPEWHPTDVGQVKLASHMMQYINIKFGWSFLGTGDEVEHGTMYWNNEANY